MSTIRAHSERRSLTDFRELAARGESEPRHFDIVRWRFVIGRSPWADFGGKSFASTQERERKTTSTAFDVSFWLGWSTNNQSAMTASTASEASTRETTQCSTIPFLAADEVTSWNQLSSTDLPRRAFSCRIGIYRECHLPRVICCIINY